MKTEFHPTGVVIKTYDGPEPVAEIEVAPARHSRTFEPCLQLTIPIAMLEKLGLRYEN